MGGGAATRSRVPASRGDQGLASRVGWGKAVLFLIHLVLLLDSSNMIHIGVKMSQHQKFDAVKIEI